MFSLKPLTATPALRRFFEILQEGQNVVTENLWDAPKAILSALAQQATGKNVVILTGGLRETRLFDDFAHFGLDNVREFPAWETLPSENIPPSPDVVGDRYAVLREIQSEKGPLTLLCPLQACLQRLLPPDRLEAGSWKIRVGDEVPFEDLVQLLADDGYARRPVAADKGEFAVRGGILDLFPVDSPDPFRLEFFGDEVEAIRLYDPIGQRSVHKVEEMTFTPAQELEILDPDNTASLFDYLGPNTLVIFDDTLALEEKWAAIQELPGAVSPTFISYSDLKQELAPLQHLYWTNQPDPDLSAKPWKHPFQELTDVLQIDEEQDLLSALSQTPDLGLNVHFVCENDSDESHLKEQLHDREVHLPADTAYERGYLSSGFVLPEANLCVVPTPEITGRYKVRRQKQRSTYHTQPAEQQELTPGDLVVHYHHGIGKYLGTEHRRDHEGNLTEFLALEYANKGKLFIPATQSHLVTKYIGAKHEKPTLHTLGTSKWQKLRTKTETAIRDYAQQLLTLHAQRHVAPGYAFPPDEPDVEKFEREFPYIETEDQINAIRAVKTDMETPTAMDRLVCGDVGYGKTEVAMRAAFKAALSGKQVAILVPTTVLAMQHYENFSARMENYPITVDVLSRFRTPKEQRQTLANLKSGACDILIGTHRLISKDIEFKNIGLVIIDEEQKFGVRVKEKIRSFRAGVDCLTLTATPIPRTLYLSLMGARDLSVINTPPQDRLPIKTALTECDDEKIKAALLRELARDGQAYFIHNRVETIYEWKERIQALAPHARIVVGHGQMTAEELDHVFHAFKTQQADILIATTIVENGIDIPNANTILIDRADTFGLSDLYQLRGRVGRWSRRAYAYFLLPKQRIIREQAEKRLKALLEIGGYGGGMKLAMRDLEIRGAGNILGTQQSGHAAAVGFHLYCKLLKKTISALSGTLPHTLTETKLEFPQPAHLPPDYISEASLRMELYQRLGSATSLSDLSSLLAELTDRFGPPPEPALWLYHIMRIRVVASEKNVSALKLRKLTLVIEKPSGPRTAVVGNITSPEDLEAKVISALGDSTP